MKNKNLIRFLHSLVLLPVLATSVATGGPGKIESAPSVLAKINIEAKGVLILNQKEDPLELTTEARASAIDAYFRAYSMPLHGTGRTMVEEADRNGLDWRLVAAIGVRESTGGKHECKTQLAQGKKNPFGWGGCKYGFPSYEHAIETVSRNLGGKNPNTAFHYKDKDTKAILQAYNPPSIVPRYADQVINIMNAIGPVDLGTVEALAKS